MNCVAGRVFFGEVSQARIDSAGYAAGDDDECGATSRKTKKRKDSGKSEHGRRLARKVGREGTHNILRMEPYSYASGLASKYWKHTLRKVFRLFQQVVVVHVGQAQLHTRLVRVDEAVLLPRTPTRLDLNFVTR